MVSSSVAPRWIMVEKGKENSDQEQLMPTSVRFNQQRQTGDRPEQVTAPDRVRNPRDWLTPTEALAPAAERTLVDQVVRRLTERAADVSAAPKGPKQRVVKAPGHNLGSERR